MYKAVIHDYDGNLVDSNTVRDGFFYYLCKKYKKPFPSDRINQFKGNGLGMKVYEELGFKLETDEDVIWEDFVHYFTNINHSPLFPGIREMIHGVKLKGRKQAIVTLNSTRIINPFLERERLSGLFDVVKTRECKCLKADMLRSAANEMKLPTSTCIFTGDEIKDITSALEVGMLPIITGYGNFCSPEMLLKEMEKHGVPREQFVDKPQDLWKTINRYLDKTS